MNYLTNYYKNLAESLQEQVSQLENLLEYRKSRTQHVDVHDVEDTGEDAPMLHGRVVTKKGNPAGKGAAKERSVSFYPSQAFKTIQNYPGHQESDAWDIISNSGRPTVEGNPIYANVRGKGPALEVDRREIFPGQERGIRGKGHHEKGRGKKAAKKREAMRKAGQQNESMTYLQRLLYENDRNNPHVDWTYYDDLRKDDEEIARGEASMSAGKKVKISGLDRVEGHEDFPDGWGARYVGMGSDGKKYSFWHTGMGNLINKDIDSDDPRVEDLDVLDQE